MGRSVLIVDDEPNIVLSLEFLMQQEGHDVRIARTGEEAMLEIGKAVPDLVLLDLMIPKPDGYEICKHLKGQAATSSVPIIILSAKGRDSERDEGLKAGADDYVTKPFSNSDVVERVRALLPG